MAGIKMSFGGVTTSRLKTLKMAVRALQAPLVAAHWTRSAPQAIEALTVIIRAYDPDFQKK